jgi:hypothetical protein
MLGYILGDFFTISSGHPVRSSNRHQLKPTACEITIIFFPILKTFIYENGHFIFEALGRNTYRISKTLAVEQARP